ncbi:MAG: hypothetical protein ACK4UT_01130 [Moraxellaceae bacterium]
MTASRKAEAARQAQRHTRWLLACLLLMAWPALAMNVQVLGAAGAQGETFVKALAQTLGPEHGVNGDETPELVVALHEGVLAEARALQKPVLVLLPDAGVALLPGEGALYWAPDWRQQLQLARVIFPGLRRVGLLTDVPVEPAQVAALRASAAARDLRLQWRQIDAEAPLRDVAELAAANDVLLAGATSRLFARDLMRPVLLAAYRQNRVFIGGGPAAVRAGTLASLHAGPEQLAEEAASRIRARLRDGRWPVPSRLQRFEVLTNPQVARALGLRLPEADALTRAWRTEEGVTWP